MSAVSFARTDPTLTRLPQAPQVSETPEVKECTRDNPTGENQREALALVRPKSGRGTILPAGDPALTESLSARLQVERMLGPRGASMRAMPEEPAHEEGEHGHNPGTVTGEAARTTQHILHNASEMTGALKEAKLGSVLSTAEDVVDGPAPHEPPVVGEPHVPAEGGHPHGKGVGILSKIGIAGGGIQMTEGAAQLITGDTKEGTKNLVAGSGYMGAGIAEVTLAEGLAETVAGPLAGGAAIVEGGVQIYDGVEEHNNGKVASGGAKAVGGALLGAAPFVSGSVVGLPVGAAMAAGGAILIGGSVVYDMFAH